MLRITHTVLQLLAAFLYYPAASHQMQLLCEVAISPDASSAVRFHGLEDENICKKTLAKCCLLHAKREHAKFEFWYSISGCTCDNLPKEIASMNTTYMYTMRLLRKEPIASSLIFSSTTWVEYSESTQEQEMLTTVTPKVQSFEYTMEDVQLSTEFPYSEGLKTQVVTSHTTNNKASFREPSTAFSTDNIMKFSTLPETAMSLTQTTKPERVLTEMELTSKPMYSRSTTLNNNFTTYSESSLAENLLVKDSTAISSSSSSSMIDKAFTTSEASITSETQQRNSTPISATTISKSGETLDYSLVTSSTVTRHSTPNDNKTCPTMPVDNISLVTPQCRTRYYFVKIHLDRDAANAYCASKFGATLVAIETEDEQSFIAGVTSLTSDFFNQRLWIGAKSGSYPYQFTWPCSGGNVAYSAWNDNEPNLNNEFCVHIYADGLWNNSPCTGSAYNMYFICERCSPGNNS